MTFLEQFERGLYRMLESGTADSAEIVRWASERVLGSYRKGITAGLKGATVKRQGESRRRGLAWTSEMRKHHGELVRRGIAYKKQSAEQKLE